MFVTRFRAALAATVVAAATATGAGVFARQAPADRPTGESHHAETDDAGKEDGDDAFERLETLRLDVACLTNEIGILKASIEGLTQNITQTEINIDSVKGGADEKHEAVNSVDVMKWRLNALRGRYIAKSKELRHKNRELAALQRGRRSAPDRPEPRRGVPELERQIAELNRKLDHVLKALEDLKRDRER